jgi:hypothetical protein
MRQRTNDNPNRYDERESSDRLPEKATGAILADVTGGHPTSPNNAAGRVQRRPSILFRQVFFNADGNFP